MKGHGCTRVTPQLQPLLCSLLQLLHCHIMGPKSAAPAQMKEAVKWDAMFFPLRHGNLGSSSCKDLPGMLLAAQQSCSGISRCQFPGGCWWPSCSTLPCKAWQILTQASSTDPPHCFQALLGWKQNLSLVCVVQGQTQWAVLCLEPGNMFMGSSYRAKEKKQLGNVLGTDK